MQTSFNKNGSNILICTFINNYSTVNIEGCNTSVLYEINKMGDCNNTLSFRKDNFTKSIFARLNINSIKQS